MIVRDAPFDGRRNFGPFLAARGLDEAVEIGTDRAAFARDLLASGWPGFLWCVDPYEPYPEMPWDRTPDLMMAIAVLAPFTPRARLVRQSSGWFARERPAAPTRVGFVYIDGAHDEASVRADITAWWPQVIPGGILAGHDFDPEGRYMPGVFAAVRDLVDGAGLEVHVVHDVDAHSWFVERPR